MTVEQIIRELRQMTYEEFNGLELINNTSYEIKTEPPFILYDIRQVDTEGYWLTTRVKTYDRMTQNKYSTSIVKITFLFVDTKLNFSGMDEYRRWLKEMPTQINFAVVDVNYMRDLSTTDNFRYRFDAWFRIHELDSRRLDRIDDVHIDINGEQDIIEFYPEEEE